MSKCEWCQTEFEQPKYRTVKFCGKECQVASYRDKASVKLNCYCCYKIFKVRKSESDRKYCSQECYVKDMPSNPNTIVKPKPTGTKICERCSAEFAPKHNFARTRFCSTDCANLSRRTLMPQNCIVCSTEFTSKKQDAKFCSRECYIKHGIPGRPKGEWITFTCIGCGEEKSVSQSYTSKKMYCSNKCAKKERKFAWNKTGLDLQDGSVLIFRSGYELRFYAVCLRFDIPIRNYDGPDIQTSLGVYRPDFIIKLYGQEFIVEIKGYMDPESETKVLEASTTNEFFMVIDKTKLLEIEKLGF